MVVRFLICVCETEVLHFLPELKNASGLRRAFAKNLERLLETAGRPLPGRLQDLGYGGMGPGNLS